MICALALQNLCRAFAAAGKPFLHPLVQFCQEPTRGIFHAFPISPVLCVRLNHADTRAWSRSHAVQRNRAIGAKSDE